jgi:hypothetical protein
MHGHINEKFKSEWLLEIAVATCDIGNLSFDMRTENKDKPVVRWPVKTRNTANGWF